MIVPRTAVNISSYKINYASPKDFDEYNLVSAMVWKILFCRLYYKPLSFLPMNAFAKGFLFAVPGTYPEQLGTPAGVVWLLPKIGNFMQNAQWHEKKHFSVLR